MIKPYHGISLFLLAILTWQCGGNEADQTAANPESAADETLRASTNFAQFATLTAKPEHQTRGIRLTGRIQALEKLPIVAEVQGKVLPNNKLLNEGVSYRKGEILLNIDDASYRLNLQAQKSQFQTALVRIMSQIQLDYPSAHPVWDEYLRQFDPTIVLPPLPKTDNEQLRYFLSANNIFATYYQIKSAEEMLPKYQIRAPFSGIVTQGSITPGTVVAPGAPLAQYSRTDVYEFKATVSASDINRVQNGQKLTLLHAKSGQHYSGTVQRKGGTIDVATQAIPVFISVSGEQLREGMFLEATLAEEPVENVVVLPLRAMNRNQQIHIIRDSTVQLQEVTPVHYDAQEVWVSGIPAGTVVITEEIIEPIVGVRAVAKK